MIKIENTEVYGWEASIRGLRNPMNSWAKSDSNFDNNDENFFVGTNDHDLMMRMNKQPEELSDFVIPTDGTESCCDHHTNGKYSYCYGCRFLEPGDECAGIEDDCNATFDTDFYRPLKRPPQSWCYAEEV